MSDFGFEFDPDQQTTGGSKFNSIFNEPTFPIFFSNVGKYPAITYYLHWNFDQKSWFEVFFHEWKECKNS